MDAEYKGNIEAVVSCKSSPCLEKARRVLQTLDMEAEYEGNVEANGEDAEYEGNIEATGEDYSAKSAHIKGRS